MLPIVTPDEMRVIDSAAPVPVETLIERSGSAVARAALRMLGGGYGRRIVVIAGPGNNGHDGRVAGRYLLARGAQVRIIEAAEVGSEVGDCDLVIDAAFGTGFRGTWIAPHTGRALVLAVDIPSGVNGLTGQAGVGVMPADHTVVLAALKPGLLFPPGSTLSGSVELADIGLSCDGVEAHLVQQIDVDEWWRPRVANAHKWQSSVRIVAGSGGMGGAAHLAASAAQRGGAGMVHLSTPGAAGDTGSHEYVRRPLPGKGWSSDVLAGLDRFQSLVIGPGLGRDESTIIAVRDVLRQSPIPTVVDGDGLFALSWGDGASAVLRDRRSPTVLTPHDGEYGLLTGRRPDHDRIRAARRLSRELGVVVLLKGPATVVAQPSGGVLVVTTGDDRLATAGTGDVLAGIIGALLAQGLSAFHAAAAGAWVHGRAAQFGPRRGLIASDLLALIPLALDVLQ